MNSTLTKKNDETGCTAANYVGNRSARCLDLVGPDKRTIRDKYLIGEPCDCPIGTAEEMKARGYVGIYLREPVTFYRLPNSNRIVPKASGDLTGVSHSAPKQHLLSPRGPAKGAA